MRLRNKVIYLTSFGLIIVIAVSFLFSSHFYYQAGTVDNLFYSECKKIASKSIPTDNSAIPTRLEAKYKIKFPLFTDTAGFSYDFDTYAKSWDDYAGGVTAGQARLAELKTKSQAITAEIQKVIGKPYHNNKTVVVYDKNFATPSAADSLNEWGLANISSQYRADLNLIIYSGTPSNDLAVHEMAHAFDDGALSIDAYEEGIVQAATKKATLALYPNSSYPQAKSTERAYTLSSPMGLFRTINSNELVDDRYEASGKFFSDKLVADPNFIINFRTKYSKSNPYFAELLNNPKKSLEKIVVDSACAELTDHSSDNKLNNYAKQTEEELSPGLSSPFNLINKYEGRFTVTNNLYKENPVIHIMPQSMLYSDIQFNPIANNFKIHATFKRSDLKDILMALYIHFRGEPSSKKIGLTTLGGFLSGTDISSAASLQDLAYLIEEPADVVILEVYKDKNIIYTEKFPAVSTIDKSQLDQTIKDESSGKGEGGKLPNIPRLGSTAASFTKDTLLSKSNLPSNYTGNLELVATSYIADRETERDDNCIRYVVGKICYPAGLKFQNRLYSSIGSISLSFNNGQVTVGQGNQSNASQKSTETLKTKHFFQDISERVRRIFH